MPTTAQKKIEMYARIKKHGEDIKKIFSLPADTDPIKLCKKLRRYEIKAQRVQDIHAAGQYEEAAREEALLLVGLVILLLKQTSGNEFGIFINRDQRGYALKIPDEIVKEKNLTIHKDVGGFGIIAPDLNEN